MAIMQNHTDRRLESLENQLRLLTRVAASLLLLACFVLGASVWRPKEPATDPQPVPAEGRYRVAGAATDSHFRFVVFDTTTGETKPIGDGGVRSQNLHKTFTMIKK